MAMLVGAFGCIGMSFTGNTGKWLTSAGLLFDMAGILQLILSGLFEKILEIYGDVQKFPYGPPSHITREIIDDPERRFRMWLRDNLFFESRTGLYLIVIGFVFQLVGNWLG